MRNFFCFLFFILMLATFSFAQNKQKRDSLVRTGGDSLNLFKRDSVNIFKPEMIENEAANKIYVGCENLYHYPRMQSLKLIGEMGTKVIEQRNGFFVIQVFKTGSYSLDIYSGAEKKYLTTIIFLAEDLPELTAAVAGRICGFISRKELLAADSLSVKSKNKNSSRVLKFKMTLVNGATGRSAFESKNNKLTPEMKQAIQTAPESSTIRFEYVVALLRTRGAGISVALPAISFILEE